MEQSDIIDLPLAAQRFVLHWGDLGGNWGVNRSVAQVHALLYLADRPLTAETIVSALGIARSNVSTSLKELQNWNLVRRVPVPGDRRDHFEAEVDLWEMVRRIAAGRKAREIDPAAAALRACVDEADADPRIGATARERLAAMLDFVETSSRWYEQMAALPRDRIEPLMRMGGKIVGLLNPKKRKKG